MVIGLSAGIVCFYSTLWLKQVIKIDDSLDVFPVHGVGGILGTFLAGIFASSELGIFSGQGLAEGVTIASQLKVQLIGIGATLAYTAVVSWILFFCNRQINRLARNRRRRGARPGYYLSQRSWLRFVNRMTT